MSKQAHMKQFEIGEVHLNSSYLKDFSYQGQLILDGLGYATTSSVPWREHNEIMLTVIHRWC